MISAIKGYFAAHPRSAKALTDIWTPVAAVLVAALIAFNLPTNANLATFDGWTITIQAFALGVGAPVTNALINAARRVFLEQGAGVMFELSAGLPSDLNVRVQELVVLARQIEDLDPETAAAVRAAIQRLVLGAIAPKAEVP